MPLDAEIQAELKQAIDGQGPLATPLRSLIRREALGFESDLVTQAELDAAILSAKEALFPVGAIYIDIVATNPGTLLGFGTWVAFGPGRTLVGIDTGDTDFDTVEETRGSKTHTLTSGEMPSHTHTQDSHNHTQDAHAHATANGAAGFLTQNTVVALGSGGTNRFLAIDGGPNTANQTATNQAQTATNQNTGGGGSHNNIQPSIVVYFWKRTA